MTQMIEISTEEYMRLLARSGKLDALERAGVDNWDGYDYALEDYYGELE